MDDRVWDNTWVTLWLVTLVTLTNDDTRSYIVFSTMFMSFELSSGDFV